MEGNSASPSPPLTKSRVRIKVYPSQTHKFPPTPLIIIFFFFTLNISTTTSIPSRFSQIPYAKHCNDVVPESAPTATNHGDHAPLQLYNTYFTGGEKILGQQSPQLSRNSRKSVSFRTRNIYQTEANGVLKLDAIISFRGSRILGFPRNSTHRRLRLVHYRPPRIPVRRQEATFWLYGFWSSNLGKLCMVGSGSSYLGSANVVLKLNYPNASTIITSLVNGTLESLDTSDSLNYFQPISMLGISLMSYKYTLIDAENENDGFSVYDDMENASLGLKFNSVCSLIRLAGKFELEYRNDCDTVNCNPLGGGTRILPGYMSFNEIECLDYGRARYLFEFSNSSYNGKHLPFDPNTKLVAEGAWDWKKKRLALVACRISNMTVKALVGDCSIRLSLSFPTTLSLRNRSTIVGQMWSNTSMNDSGYFGRIAFQSSENGDTRLEGLKYEYTEIDNARRTCMKKMTVKGKGGTYPDAYSSNMRFDMTVRNIKGQIAWGYSSPLSVGDKIYKALVTFASSAESAIQVNNSHGRVLNISYVMSYAPPPDFKLDGDVSSTKSVDISAEGIYDAETGMLCMIGCRHLGSLNKKLQKNNSLDCEILVNVQYSPLNAKDGSHVKGTIESTRGKADPFYFERVEVLSSSIYTRQAKESIQRMDLEITMVIISNTLACIFVGLQLFYVKNHPQVLPFISVVMLIVLTLAHMIPLVLNFEALFLANRNRQNIILDSGGWLEVNEVLVRVITMIAFLLQFRFLQLTWSARLADGSQRNLWLSDKKVLYLSLPLYVGGSLIAWFVHQQKYSHKSTLLRARHFGYQPQSIWGDFKSYAGLVLDGFLFPQIVFNVFSDLRERALAPPFYVGTTVVRLLPHAYDLYRTHSSTWYFDNIYANQRMDYYSTAWDVMISCGGLLCVALIYLQQRFGGRCFLPKRYRESSVYEKVPVVSSE
uniref:RING-type E3 ubiquitin transferase n=1 Tax=Davidia involucrata TaxID=16924 RepID=A0A5B6Z5T6_DAVIN